MLEWAAVQRAMQAVSPVESMEPDEHRALWNLANGLPDGALIVELGVAYGMTLILLQAAAENCHGQYVGVDDWRFGFGSCQAVAALLTPGVGRLINAPTATAPWTGGLIDLLVIDAGHDYPSVHADAVTWLPRVRAGGHVAFHDHGKPEWGVTQAVAETTVGCEFYAEIGSLYIVKT